MTSLEYDMIIVGSGAGGGAVAKELSTLCARGARIALLEWGGRFAAKDNTREEAAMAERIYFDSGGFQTRSQDMTLAFAKAVGGSTTVYTGTSLKMERHVLEEWGVPGLTLEDLEPRYEKYKKENGVHFTGESELNENNRLFRESCRSLGWKHEQFPINTRDCKGLGTCNLGCARLAKQGTAEVQIPMAKRNGVQVFPFCRVDRIEDHDVVAEILPPEHGLEPSPLPPGPIRFRAKKIVVCGGAIQTPALLFRSYGEFLPMLGRYFTCQPALMIAGSHPRPIQNTEGHPKSFLCNQFLESHHVLLESCMYFPFTLAKSLTGFGKDVDDFIARFDRLQMILILAIDPAERDNRVSIKRTGEPRVDYRFHERTIGSLLQGIRRASDILFESGCEDVHAPAAESFLIHRKDRAQLDRLVAREHFKLGKISLSAAHIMGGARMGSDPSDSVTDPWGRVHGKPDLYVADASLFPKAAGVNPYLTVMAIADRVAEAVRKDLGA